MKKSKQTSIGRKLEKHFKGASNYRRIDILLLLNKNDGLILEDIANGLDADYKTVSEHTRRLTEAGLINKHYVGRAVSHSLSPYGRKFVKFIKTF